MIPSGCCRRSRWLLAFAAVVIILSTTCNHPASSSSGSPGKTESPIGDGTRTSLAEAEQASKKPLLLPDTPLANGQVLSEVWSQPIFGEFAFVYERDGKRLVVDEYEATSPNPAGAFEEEAALGVADSRIGGVNGRPALITEPRTDNVKSNPADVRFVLHGMEVNVFSDDYSTEQLIALAKSVHAEDTGEHT
jgi:hypothetical protein